MSANPTNLGPQPTAAACTIVSPNYLAYARTLAASYLAHHPTHRFFVLIVASLTDPTPFAAEPFETVLLTALNIPNLPAIAFQYDILELNTNVKPTFLRHLFATHALTHLTYLDPDIFVYAPLTPVFEALATNDAVLTPHITAPILDAWAPSEQDHLYNGTYNLGFIALRNTPAADQILLWWQRHCLHNAFSEGRTGLFVDQKWMNLAPGLFPDIAILRHPGTNMAYWNLQHRTLSGPETAPLVNSHEPLIFFHFSGIVLDDPASLSRNTDRFTLAQRPDLQSLFAAYKSTVLANQPAETLPYGFDTFTDGTAITRLARRIFSRHQAHFASPSGDADPFDHTAPFYQFARAERLIAGATPPPKSSWSEFRTTDRRVALVHKLLRFTLRRLGPNRYELLMRYLAYISVLRNQSTFLKPPTQSH